MQCYYVFLLEKYHKENLQVELFVILGHNKMDVILICVGIIILVIAIIIDIIAIIAIIIVLIAIIMFSIVFIVIIIVYGCYYC